VQAQRSAGSGRGLRILMISDVYFPRINGVSTSIRYFRKELADLGHEVTLIAPRYGPGDDPDAAVFRIPSRFLPIDPEDRMMKRGCIAALQSTLEQSRFDIIHIQTPFVAHYAGVALSRRLGIPRVETCHTHFEEYLHHYLPFLPRPLMRLLARRFNRSQCNDVNGVIVPSQAMLDVLRGYGIERPIEIIPTGIEENFFRQGDGAKFRAEHGVAAERPVLVHVGRLAHEKNIDFLMHMLRELRAAIPDVLLLIAGEGPAERHLRELAGRLELNGSVKFTGYLDRGTTLLDCYAAGDAFVFSSKTETQGLVLLEAMAQGTPVVSVSELGTRDILLEGQGAVIAPEHAGEFAMRVACLLRDSGMRAWLAAAARNHARRWSSRRFAERKAAFYRSTIDASR
jgi:glycosyltransferase involved in cell wall biosynthesis